MRLAGKAAGKGIRYFKNAIETQRLKERKMRETKVLLLGWDFVPAGQEEPGQTNGCFAMAKALGGRVDLSMILPATDPDFTLYNVALTGLNNVDLPAIEPVGPKKNIQPFAQGAHIRQQIPLYGAPIHPVGQQASTQAEQIGQAASAGTLQQQGEQKEDMVVAVRQNIFDPGRLGQVALDAQIIQYARWATRLAAHRQFHVIYAYDWRTFLAGSELKLVSEKPLVLQVDSLNEEHGHAANQAWKYQLQVQALQKADCIIAATEELAAILVEKYDVSPDVVFALERKKSRPAGQTIALSEGNPAGLPATSSVKGGAQSAVQASAAKADPEEKRERAADRIRDILLQVVA